MVSVLRARCILPSHHHKFIHASICYIPVESHRIRRWDEGVMLGAEAMAIVWSGRVCGNTQMAGVATIYVPHLGKRDPTIIWMDEMSQPKSSWPLSSTTYIHFDTVPKTAVSSFFSTPSVVVAIALPCLAMTGVSCGKIQLGLMDDCWRK